MADRSDVSVSRDSDGGFTLAELLVAMVISSIVIAVTATIFIASTRLQTGTQASTEALQAARRSINTMGREVVAAEGYTTAVKTGSPASWYWEFQVPAADGATAPECYQWRYSPDATELRWRRINAATSAASDWVLVAKGMTNNPAVSPFVVTPSSDQRLFPMVTMTVKMDSEKALNVEESASFAMRNVRDASTSVCSGVSRP